MKYWYLYCYIPPSNNILKDKNDLQNQHVIVKNFCHQNNIQYDSILLNTENFANYFENLKDYLFSGRFSYLVVSNKNVISSNEEEYEKIENLLKEKNIELANIEEINIKNSWEKYKKFLDDMLPAFWEYWCTLRDDLLLKFSNLPKTKQLLSELFNDWILLFYKDNTFHIRAFDIWWNITTEAYINDIENDEKVCKSIMFSLNALWYKKYN